MENNMNTILNQDIINSGTAEGANLKLIDDNRQRGLKGVENLSIQST